ncbi:CBY1-interacting BAR domain-containing protein 1 [Synchiropus picturatus]
MSLTPDARARDNQTKRIQENITNVERHFGKMCQMFAGYVRKTARLRDKADLLVREISLYADTETPNLKVGMKHFADNLAKIQDYRQAEVERLDAKVVEPLKSYGAVVKHKREDLKATQNAREREAKQMAELEKTRQRNPSDRQIIVSFLNLGQYPCLMLNYHASLSSYYHNSFCAYEFVTAVQTNSVSTEQIIILTTLWHTYISVIQAESELQRATMDAARTTRQLEETFDEFQKQKIRDIKRIFSEFMKVEMSFHAKALEVYTLAYQGVQNVDEQEDLEVFRSLLHPPDYQSRLDIVRANSKSSLDRTGSFLSTSGTTQQQASARLTRRNEAEFYDDDDDDDDSDDEEEEEEEEED